jgi:hypothetical protein
MEEWVLDFPASDLNHKSGYLMIIDKDGTPNSTLE